MKEIIQDLDIFNKDDEIIEKKEYHLFTKKKQNLTLKYSEIRIFEDLVDQNHEKETNINKDDLSYDNDTHQIYRTEKERHLGIDRHDCLSSEKDPICVQERIYCDPKKNDNHVHVFLQYIYRKRK